MASKLAPAAPNEWANYYEAANQRRRQAGWHRRSESRPVKTRLDGGRLLAIVMGLATVTVLLCLAIPA